MVNLHSIILGFIHIYIYKVELHLKLFFFPNATFITKHFVLHKTVTHLQRNVEKSVIKPHVPI